MIVTGPDWRTMTRDAFDTDAATVQTALLPAPDPAGTLDLFVELDAAPACVWDSGSATGCRPVCDAPATEELTHTGYHGPYVVRLCRRHADRLAGRIYPDRVTSRAPL